MKYMVIIEEVQKLLGDKKIEIIMRYALVKQSNVKFFYRKYIG